MREILFRGKRLDNGEWVEGFYTRLTDNWTQKNLHYITCFKDLDNGETIWVGTHVCDPATIGQLTLLTDKQGKRIFEGDILRYSYDYPGSPWLKAEGKTDKDIVYRTGDVFWQEWRGSWAVSSRVGKHGMNQDVFQYCRNPNRVEVIGNIHDNPELLREVEDNG